MNPSSSSHGSVQRLRQYDRQPTAPSVGSVLRCSGSLLLLLQCRLESAETERHRGLDEPTSPFSPADAGLTSADKARHAASRHRPLHGAPHISVSAHEPAPQQQAVFLHSCGPRQRGFPPVVGVGRPFSCHSGRSPLTFRAFLPLSFRAQSRNLSPAGTFQPTASNHLILKYLQNHCWKVPRKNRPPSSLVFANNSHSTIYETEAGRWREGHDPCAAK